MIFDSSFIKNVYAEATLTLVDEEMSMIKYLFGIDTEKQHTFLNALYNNFANFNHEEITDDDYMAKCIISSTELDSDDLTKGFTCRVNKDSSETYIAKLETAGYIWEWIPYSFIKKINDTRQGATIIFPSIKAVSMQDPNNVCLVNLCLNIRFSSSENLKLAKQKAGIKEEKKEEQNTTVFLFYPNQDRPHTIQCDINDCKKILYNNGCPVLIIEFEHEIRKYVGIPFEIVCKKG